MAAYALYLDVYPKIYAHGFYVGKMLELYDCLKYLVKQNKMTLEEAAKKADVTIFELLAIWYGMEYLK